MFCLNRRVTTKLKIQRKYQEKNGVKYSFIRHSEYFENTIMDISRGYEADAVIVTAAMTSFDPLNFASTISRGKGRLIIVGAVLTGYNRVIYYKKELDLKMSCFYRPDRYDDNYENKVYDYPNGYI